MKLSELDKDQFTELCTKSHIICEMFIGKIVSGKSISGEEIVGKCVGVDSIFRVHSKRSVYLVVYEIIDGKMVEERKYIDFLTNDRLTVAGKEYDREIKIS